MMYSYIIIYKLARSVDKKILLSNHAFYRTKVYIDKNFEKFTTQC